MDQTNLNKNLSSLSTGKMVMLGVFPVLMMTVNLLMSVFAPFPIALSSVLYGRKKGISVALIGLATCILLAQFVLKDVSIVIFFFVCAAVALGLAEAVTRGINPIHAIIGIGSSLIVLVSLAVYVQISSSGKTVENLLIGEFEKIQPLIAEQVEKIEASGGPDSFEVVALLSQPKLLAQEVLKEAPAYFLIGIFVTLWINLFLLLKSRRVAQKLDDCNFTERDLLNFKMPDEGVWFVIGFLALAIWGDFIGPWYSVIGMTCLKTIGVFYFFQGFGIYLAFLDYVKLTGFFRSLLVVLTVLSATKVLAVVGLIDMFINFQELMKKKDQGDLK